MVERNVVVSSLLAAALLGGCTMAPAYTRPDAPVSDVFSSVGASDAQSSEEDGPATADLGWKEVYGDARLQHLLSMALEHNRDLRVAALNVERVQAMYRIQRAPLFPNLGASGSATFQELPAAIPSSAFMPKAQYSVGLAVTAWELDFFGRVRSLSDKALQEYLATDAARRSAHLALVSQVAIAHFNERAQFEQLELATKTLETVEESFRMTHRAFELGTASELDFRTAESQVETARYNYAFFEQRRAQAVNALTLLVGQPLPEDLPEAPPLKDAQVKTDLPAGLPSDLLTRRPDIVAAERVLMGANANIGAARAAFFPSISLTGNAGLSSPDLGQLFSGDAFTWSFVPRINLPIFQGGALKANLDVATITKQIEIANYEKTIQAAFREVSDALATRATIDKQLDAQQKRVEAEEQRYRLAELRYREGIERYVTLLTAQRDLYSAQQALIETQFAHLTNVANLYRALGGGWEAQTQQAQRPDAAP